MRRWHATGLLVAAACTEPQRPAGALRTLADLVDAARAGDPDGTASVALRDQPLLWLSSPYNPGSAVQESGRDGLVVQPAFADARPAAFVTSEIWDGFPRVWAQPIYILVTGFDAQLGPQKLAGAFPVFGLSPRSRFYSPYWQTFYVTVPAGFAADSFRNSEDVVASGLPLTPGPLRFCVLGPKEMEVAHPAGLAPVHPFTADALQPRLTGQGWAEGELVWVLDFGIDRYRVNDSLVVQEVALFRFALLAPDGTQQLLNVPPVVGTGPLRTPRPADAPNGFPRFGALRHEYIATITPRAGQPVPGIFVSASRAALRQKLTADVGAAFLPPPSAAAERLAEREQYTMRVALDGSCFGLTDFPNSCTWLDTQGSIEGNLPVTAFTDTKRFSSGAFVFFDGVAP
jgi:hypothetical protein